AVRTAMLDLLSLLPTGPALKPEATGPRFPALGGCNDLRSDQGVDLGKRGIEFLAEVATQGLGSNAVCAEAPGDFVVSDATSRHRLDRIPVCLGRFVCRPSADIRLFMQGKNLGGLTRRMPSPVAAASVLRSS